MKQLSIIIPTYNMEKYLRRCLDSLLVKKNLNLLEVWVVNDGSKDRSSSIAHEYETKYPDVFHVLDKPNGNYGSCINAALKVITGKYIKVLDADDWFDTNELFKFIKMLEHTDSDLVITNFTEIYSSEHTRNIDYAFSKNNYDIDDIELKKFKTLQMHAVTYKAGLFKTINYKQTEGISYTDQEWIFCPMYAVKTICFYPYHVYQYFLGREGQTMDIKNVIKHLNDLICIVKRMITTYHSWDKNKMNSNILSYLDYKIEFNASRIYKIGLLTDSQKESLKQVIELDSFIKDNDLVLYRKLENITIHTCLPYHFIKHFHISKKRPSWAVRSLTHILKAIKNYNQQHQ